MTEQEFINELKKTGYKKREIKETLWVTEKMKIEFPDFTYEEFLPFVKNAYEDSKNTPKGFITL